MGLKGSAREVREYGFNLKEAIEMGLAPKELKRMGYELEHKISNEC